MYIYVRGLYEAIAIECFIFIWANTWSISDCEKNYTIIGYRQNANF